ncbi:MAG: 1,4-dihydroxy-2-naphthoate octaprenyltransferase [Fimbriimonadaceae bacterium]|nr:1,4-dihydroxy-2-naphthoate octaprenyltransferase [Fimbriimonadaceae bacterium]
MHSSKSELPISGSSPSSPRSISAWVQALRPRTLPLAVAPIALAGGLAAYQDRFSTQVFALCLVTALFLQILSNLANDLGDALKGTDDAARTGPKRAVASGWISARQMRFAVGLVAVLAVVSGVALLMIAPVVRETWFLVGFGVAGLAAVASALGYTLGKRAFGYSGLGDLVVFLFFGLVGVVGAATLVSGAFLWQSTVAGAGIGMLAAGVLNVNNLRDQKGDALHGKRTLVVRLGDARARRYHIVLVGVAGILLAGLPAILGSLTVWWTWIPSLLLLPAIKQAKEVTMTPIGPALNPYLGKLSMLTALWGISLGVAFSLA